MEPPNIFYTRAVMENILPQVIRWRDWAGSGLEHVILSEKIGFISAQSSVISGSEHTGFAAQYSLKLDQNWCVLEVEATVLGAADSVSLRHTNEGQWFDDNNSLLPDLQGIFDVDLSITPFTNTLPIRRLRLGIGESAEITTAYISFPQLTVSPDPQRYTRLSLERYRYESRNSDFAREIIVDRDGLVITYPGLFRRVEP